MNVDVFSLWVFIRHMILNIHLRKKRFLYQIGNSASNLIHFHQDIWRMNVDVFSLWVVIRHMILNIHLRMKRFLCQIGNSASNQKHFYQDIQSIKIDVYTLRVFIRHIIWINSLLNAFRFKKISHLIGFYHEQL